MQIRHLTGSLDAWIGVRKHENPTLPCQLARHLIIDYPKRIIVRVVQGDLGEDGHGCTARHQRLLATSSTEV